MANKFKWFPIEQKQFWRPEAIKLREAYLYAGLMHLILLPIDIFIYKFELAALVFDYIFIFISYNNFMQLFIPVCFGQLLGYCFTTTIALTHL